MDLERRLQLLERCSRSALRRLRLNAALAALGHWLPALFVYLACVLAVSKLIVLPPAVHSGLVGGGALGTVWLCLIVLRAVQRKLPWQAGSLALDRYHALSDRVTTALEFGGTPATGRSRMMQLVIEEAAEFATQLRPRQAVPLRATRDFVYSALLGLVVALLASAQLPVVPPERVATNSPTLIPFVVEADDLELMRDLSEQLKASENGSQPEQKVVQRFNQLVEDIAERRLDRATVLARLEELQRELAPLDAEQVQALEQALQGVASALQTNAQTKAVAQALQQNDLPDAERALRELAEKLKKKPQVDRKALEDLRKALEAASHESTARSERLAAQRGEAEQERQRLLKKKQQAGGKSDPANDAEIERNRRELQRLDRDRRRAQAGQQQLSELDRQLAEAARRLFEDMGQGAEHLESGAQELERMQQQKMSDQEKEQLKKQLEALRELLRQQGKGGEQQRQRLREFARRARGESPGQQPSAGRGVGQVLLPMGTTSASAAGAGKGGQQGQGNQAGGNQPGSSTDPNLQGQASQLQGELQDVSAAGMDTGEGPSASSLVHGAAEKGFVGGGYKRVYTEYKTVAEETLERDHIPAGYEQYVRRYFQLIRPRD